MRIFFAFLLSFIGVSAVAQDSWKVYLDKNILLSTSAEDAEKNIVSISPADLKKNKNLIVTYIESSPQKGWERSIMLYDENGKELKKQTGKKLILKTSELKTLFDKTKTIKIYTVNMPTDPKMKAQIRIRRVHLCTLVLE